jgi:hypothetical protein
LFAIIVDARVHVYHRLRAHIQSLPLHHHTNGQLHEEELKRRRRPSASRIDGLDTSNS